MMRSIANQAAGAAFNAIVGFVLLAVLGRLLAPADFAHYVALLSAAAVAVIVIAGGNPAWLYRAGVDRGPEAMRARTGLSVAQALAATALLAAAFAPQGADAVLAMLCAGGLVLADFVSAQLRAAGRFGHEAAWQAALRLASALAIVAAVLWVARNAGAIFLAWLVATALLLALLGRRLLAWPRFEGLAAHLRALAPLLAVDTLLALATKGDVAVLATAFAPEDLAGYAACSRFVDAAILAFAPVSNVQLRYLGLRRAAPREFAHTWGLAAAAGAALGLAAFAASVAAGDTAVALAFGRAYAGTGRLLAWIALALPFLLANLVLIQAMLAAGRERALALTLALGALAWLAGLLFGARHGLEGAALGAAFAHAAIAAGLVLQLRGGVR